MSNKLYFSPINIFYLNKFENMRRIKYLIKYFILSISILSTLQIANAQNNQNL